MDLTLSASDTAERLRSKHVRTLEMLQKIMDENLRLKAGQSAPVAASTDDAAWGSRLAAQRDAGERAVSAFFAPFVIFCMLLILFVHAARGCECKMEH